MAPPRYASPSEREAPTLIEFEPRRFNSLRCSVAGFATIQPAPPAPLELKLSQPAGESSPLAEVMSYPLNAIGAPSGLRMVAAPVTRSTESTRRLPTATS